MSHSNQGPSSSSNANDQTANSLPLPQPPAASTSNMSLNPAQLQQLTDFHRQQAQFQSRARPPPAPVAITLPDHIRQGIAALGQGPAKEEFIARYFKTDEGMQKLQLFNQQKAQQKLQQANAIRQQIGPARTSSDLPPDASPPASNVVLPNQAQAQAPSTPAPNQPRPSIPITKAFDPATYTRPTPHPAMASDAQSQGQGSNNNRFTPANQSLLPSSERERPPWQNPTPSSYTPYRRAPSPERGGGSSRRREDGMRGTMRSELARLMYASGDVENPDVDTIDYMEDLVVDWLAELCAPPPAVRATPSAPLTTPRLDYNIIRHRLSRPSLRKYLDRFEYMEYKAVDMRSARRVAKGNFEPVDQKDLDRQLEKGFLDGEDAGADAAGGPKKKRKYRRQGQGDDKDKDKDKERDKKKPGPKKGWRKPAPGAGGRGSSTTAPSRGGSIKPEES